MRESARRRILPILLLLMAVVLPPAPLPAGDVIIQYFESRWETIERRMPDVFLAGYDAIWVPPPGKADSGGFSVGYDVYDRFNLGTPFDRTLYGTAESFSRLSREMDRAGVQLHVDVILNHNGFRDASTPGFEAAGGYPGFVTTLPGDVDGDFHGAFESGDLNMRLAGLIDIAQEKNHQFIRHPVDPDNPQNIPNEQARDSNRFLYPPFDGTGTPTLENATGLLLRNLRWLVEVHGVDGFRIDAQKHIPTWFFNSFYDPTVHNLGTDPISGDPFTPFAYGEVFDGNTTLLNSYIRKDGFGNRDVLDFPLFWAMKNVFDAGGFGSMRDLEFASIDSVDGNANDGTRGVQFVNSHDDFGGGFFNGYSNLPHAHILTRAGFPVVYYNAREFGTGRDFPKDGRGDALGNFGDRMLTLLRINKEYIRGAQATRWIDDDTYVYERLNSALIALNDRGDAGFDSRNVQTAFAPGTVLVELTGNATSTTVDPSGDIFDSVTVGSDSRVTIRVPRNRSSAGFHGRGYVIYGPEAPRAMLSIDNAAGTLGPDSPAKTPEGTRRVAVMPIVTSDTINVSIEVAAGPEDDNALIRLNGGGDDLDGDETIVTTGEFAGFESFTTASPTFGGGTGDYSIEIDATGLDDGYQYIETATFLHRTSGPPIYNMQRAVVYLDRVPPQVDLVFPQSGGSPDIASRTYEAVIRGDRTVNAVHLLRDVAPDATDGEILAMVNASNRARHHDRLEWRFVMENLADGLLELTIVAFEETGTYSITRFGDILVELSFPEVRIGVDTNSSPTAVNFQPMPGTINSSMYEFDIVVRVDTQNGPSGPISFPADFTVTLQVDDLEPMVAVPYDPGLLPPVGRLVQNDQNLGDQWDEFRFVWRGYSTGGHTFHARAELTDMSRPPYDAVASTFVPEGTPGPGITITTPAPPGDSIDNPSSINVAGSFSVAPAFAQVFMDTPGGSILLGSLDNPPAGAFSVSKPVGSYTMSDLLPPGAIQTENGTFTVRVVATTGPNGGGIASEASSAWTITGQSVPPLLPTFAVDGNVTDTIAMPVLAVSAANGGTGGGNPTDFGADGTLTELRASIRDGNLVVALRGDMFGPDETNTANVSILLMDVNPGSGEGATDIANQLTDSSDGLRGNISNARFVLHEDLVNAGFGIDAVVGMTAPTIAFGYTLGTDGTAGSFSNFAYQPGIIVAYDSNAESYPAAPGTTIAGPGAFEMIIPLAALGNPDPSQIALAAVTASNDGFPSPNTLPENSNNAFDNVQTLEEMAAFGKAPPVLVNEVSTGHPDRIELFNPGTAAVDLGGWALRMNDSGIIRRDYVFPGGTTIEAGSYLVLTDESSDTGSRGIVGLLDVGFNLPWHATRGGSIALMDQHGIAVDYVTWLNADGSLSSEVNEPVPAGTAWSGTVNGPPTGMSIARDEVSTDTDTAGDWSIMSSTFGFPNVESGLRDGWFLFGE